MGIEGPYETLPPMEDGADHINALASLRRELGASKAHVDQAPRGFATLFGAELFRLSHCLLGAIAQVRPVRHDHRRLGAEQELVLRDPCRPEARTNLRARVVSNVPIEITAMTILVGLLLHSDLHVDVITVLVRHPPIDLHSDAKGKAHMHDFQRLVRREGCVHKSTNAVVLDAHWRLGTGKLRWERSQDGLPIPRCRLRRDPELVATQKGTANHDLLSHRKAFSIYRRLVAALDQNGVALHNPILSLRVV